MEKEHLYFYFCISFNLFSHRSESRNVTERHLGPERRTGKSDDAKSVTFITLYQCCYPV